MGITEPTEQGDRRLVCVFDRLRNDVIDHLETMPVEAIEWFCCNDDFNIRDGELAHHALMSVVDFMEILRGETLSDDEYFKAALLELCIMLLQASRVHIYSDMQLVCKNQCLYAGDNIVIKDSFWLDSAIYYLLKKYFCAEVYYVNLIELFHETTFQAETGQLVNLVTVPKDRVDLSKFSLQRHASITRSRIPSFYLPVALAMCICGIPETYTLHGCLFSPYITARSILFQLGEYFQIQEDFLNYVGAVEAGGTRSDIAENKCSWCINVALIVAAPEQRKVLEENYGKKDLEKEMRVREVYESIGLREQYRVYEASMKERIEVMIAGIPEPEGDVNGCVLKKEAFTRFFDEIYKRTVEVR